MADPIWLDTSTLGDIAAGDPALEAEVVARRNAGSELLMVPKVREEALFGNPFINKPGKTGTTSAETAKAVQDAIDRLGVKVDLMGSEADRRALFENQFKFKADRTAVRALAHLAHRG
jgi:hypothetical protein